MEEDIDGWNAFDWATLNEDPETFLAIKDLYVKTFGEEKVKIMLTRERDSGESILLTSVTYDDDNVATVKALWKFIQEIFDISTQKMILMKEDLIEENLHGKILNRKDFDEFMKIFEPFIEKHLTALEKNKFKYGDREWLRNYFTEKNENGESVVSLILKSNRNDFSPYYQLSAEKLYSIIDSLVFKFLPIEDITALRSELEKTKEVALGLKYFQHFLNSWTINGKSIYYEFCNYLSSIKDFEKLWMLLRRILGENDFKFLIKKPNSDGWTPLMLKATNEKKEVFIFFWKLLSEDLTGEEKDFILMEEDIDGWNAFDWATLNEDPETFLAIKDLYVKTFGEEKVKIMLTRERDSGESILLTSVSDDDDNVATVKALWKFIQEIFDISNQKTILLKTNVNGNTLHEKILNKKYFNELMKIFEQFIEENLIELEKEQFKYGIDKQWMRNYFTEKNENGESVASLIFERNRIDSSPYDQLSDEELYSIIDSSIFKFLSKADITALRSELEKTKEIALGMKLFQHFLISETTDGATIYYEVCRRMWSIEDFEKLWKLLRRILGKTDLKILIKKPTRCGGLSTPLMFKAFYRNKEVFISFWKLLTENLTDEEKEKLLFDEDGDGDNGFDCATCNKDPETFLAIKDLYLKTFGENKMKIMLMRERKFGESILHVSVGYDDDNVATVKALWTFIQEIFDISNQKTILMKTNVNGNTLHEKILNKKYFNELMKIFEPFIEENLTALEKVQFKYKSEQNKIIGSYSNQEPSKVVGLAATSDEENKNKDIEQIDHADEK